MNTAVTFISNLSPKKKGPDTRSGPFIFSHHAHRNDGVHFSCLHVKRFIAPLSTGFSGAAPYGGGVNDLPTGSGEQETLGSEQVGRLPQDSSSPASETYGGMPTPRSFLLARTVPRQNQYPDPGRTNARNAANLHEMPMNTRFMELYGMV